MIDYDSLRRCPPLDEVPRNALEALAGHGRDVHFEKEERLVPRFDPPERLLFITEGLAKMTAVSANGIERIVYVFRPCDIAGAHALQDESPEGEYEIVAMEPVSAVAVAKRHVLKVGREHPEVLLAITRSFSDRIAELNRRMLAAMSTEVPVRLSSLLIDFASGDGGDRENLVPLTHPLTHEAMAQIIGASRPHTSTVLRDLEQTGAVQRQSGDGLLVRPGRLEEIVARGEFADNGRPSA